MLGRSGAVRIKVRRCRWRCTALCAPACLIGLPVGAAQAQRALILDFRPEALQRPAPTAVAVSVMADQGAYDFTTGMPVIANEVQSAAGPGSAPPVAAFRLPPAIPAAVWSRCYDMPYRPRGDLSLATEARRAIHYLSVVQAACEAGVPVGLLDALVVQESRYQPSAVSPKGAIGLTQLMPATARYLSVPDAFDPVANLRGGARYLREQLTSFGRVDLALAAYNAGPARIRRRRAVPAIAETQAYVSVVTRGWQLGISRAVALLRFAQPAALWPAAAPVPERRHDQVLVESAIP